MPTNDRNRGTGDHAPPTGDFIDHPNPGRESAKLGYETTDVNAGGVVVFLGGLFGFVLIFFAFCFLLGKVINTAAHSHRPGYAADRPARPSGDRGPEQPDARPG